MQTKLGKMFALDDKARAQLVANGRARASGSPIDAYPIVRLYTPDAGAVWLLTELDAAGDLAYGLCDVGLGFPELGTVRLSDLAAMRGPHGFRVAVDTEFLARQPLSAYAAQAAEDGTIDD
jgi:Protein of unknown function (DUF2958)